jgi:hypothetical protein
MILRTTAPSLQTLFEPSVNMLILSSCSSLNFKKYINKRKKKQNKKQNKTTTKKQTKVPSIKNKAV